MSKFYVYFMERHYATIKCADEAMAIDMMHRLYPRGCRIATPMSVVPE